VAAVSGRIALPAALLGTLLAGLVVVGACALLLLFNFARATENLAFGGDVAAVETASGAPVPSAEAQADIPPLYLALYRQAGARFGLDWAVLAGIGRVECDHGRDPAPSCTVEGQLNPAGAGGPAQFLVSTWRRYGISATGEGTPDMWRPADAILSMANYLRAAGAPGDYGRAIYAYNHAWWYVAEVLAWARRYRAAFAPTRASAP
jgi:Transglycosylase SLT domain